MRNSSPRSFIMAVPFAEKAARSPLFLECAAEFGKQLVRDCQKGCVNVLGALQV